MSASMLPKWKQFLLDRKRREEEEREKKDREEEEKLASMPAWKRGIIQRRRAKQEGGREKERDKVTEAGRESEPETGSVKPIWKKDFTGSQNSFRRDQQRKEMDKWNNEGKRQTERMSGDKEEQYNETEDNGGEWGDGEIKMERTKEIHIIEGMKEREIDAEKGNKVETIDYAIFPLISGIHTMKAENLIIIKNQGDEKETDGERETEERMKQGMRMDLKDFLAGGKKVTEICVLEMLIIKPSSKEERSKEERKQGDEDWKKTTLVAGEKNKEETECRRVNQLISKFGENYKRPCRSKSDCFIPMELGEEVRNEERKKGDRKDEYCGGSVNTFRGVPKRSFSFSEKMCKERSVLERSYSDWRKGEIDREVEKKEKKEKERNKEVNKTDKNTEIFNFKGEIQKWNKQKEIIEKEKMSGETEKKMVDIQKERNDREPQTEVKGGQSVTPVLQSMVKFFDGEIKSQSNMHEQMMSKPWNEAIQHRREIVIPRSLFYESSEQSCFSEDGDEVRRGEQRSIWKAGRPLTRVESLRERIWQKDRGGTYGGAKEAEMESRQEVASPQSLSQFDVTREVSIEELPVCVPPSLSAEREPSVFNKRHDGVIGAPQTKKGQEEDLLGEDYIPLSSSSSSSSSPAPLSNTLPAMSRIYNLKPVTSRAGVCITERNLDVQTHGGGMIKIRPGGQSVSGPSKIQTELFSVQRQVEQLHLREQEVRRQNDGEASQKLNETDQEENVDTQKSQTNTILKPSSSPRVQTQPPQISTSTTKSVNSQIQPSVSTAATPLFTIRSASRGPGKRGATITITPRKTGPLGTPSSSVTTSKVPSSSITTPKFPSNMPEQCKKRYPTAEEIEVIGGYQSLERSCLVKNRGSPKMVRVCFDDSQLECVCTYPSEESVVREEGSSDDWRRVEEKKEEKDEDEEDEDGVIGAGKGMSRFLRVDESCRR